MWGEGLTPNIIYLKNGVYPLYVVYVDYTLLFASEGVSKSMFREVVWVCATIIVSFFLGSDVTAQLVSKMTK